MKKTLFGFRVVPVAMRKRVAKPNYRNKSETRIFIKKVKQVSRRNCVAVRFARIATRRWSSTMLSPSDAARAWRRKVKKMRPRASASCSNINAEMVWKLCARPPFYVFKQFQRNFVCFPFPFAPSALSLFPSSIHFETFFFYQLFGFVFRITFCCSAYLLCGNLSISFSVAGVAAAAAALASFICFMP